MKHLLSKPWLRMLFIYGLFEVGLFICLEVVTQLGMGIPTIDTSSLHKAQTETLQTLLKGGDSFLSWDSELGWTTRPNSISKDGLNQINNQGLRNQRLYPFEKKAGTTRILTFGDSFTYGAFVSGQDTWQEQLMHWDDRFEVLNFGVPGYSLDQAYLRYQRENKHFQTDYVFIGYMSENINRLMNRYRPFYEPQSKLAFSKPRFYVHNGKLNLMDNPLKGELDYQLLADKPDHVLPLLAKGDHWADIRPDNGQWLLPSLKLYQTLRYHYKRRSSTHRLFEPGRPYSTESIGYEVLTKLLKRFYQQVLSDGAMPVIVLYPHPHDIQAYRKNRSLSYEPLKSFLVESQLCFIDGVEAFNRWAKERSPDQLFVNNHYSRESNLYLLGLIHNWMSQPRNPCLG